MLSQHIRPTVVRSMGILLETYLVNGLGPERMPIAQVIVEKKTDR